jgi:hypothetical protein
MLKARERGEIKLNCCRCTGINKLQVYNKSKKGKKPICLAMESSS